MFVNCSSTFALEQGLFSDSVEAVFGHTSTDLVSVCSSVLIMILSGGYALWLWKKAGEWHQQKERDAKRK
jgi:nucleoside recognition membrane protein YjiH